MVLPLIKIQVGNSYSRIIGLSVEELKSLQKKISYVPGGASAFYSGYGSRRKSLVSKRGDFPTGLYDRVVRNLTGFVECINTNRSPRRVVIELNKLPFIPHKWQKEAAELADMYKRGTVEACTASGKSFAIALTLTTISVPTLIVVPTLELKRQLTEDLNNYLEDTKYVTVENIDSANLKKPSNYGLLIIDEVHHSASKTYQTLNKKYWTNIPYRICFTATAFRNDSEETLLFESIAGQVIYRLSYKEALKQGIVCPIEAYYYELPIQQTDAYTYAEVYKELVVRNEFRNKLISSTIISLKDRATLCLVKEVAHGLAIQKYCGEYFVHGEDEGSRQYISHFNNKRITSLIGTTGILGEGVDTKPAEFIIIAGLGKAKSQFMQQIGRGLRKYPGKESAKIIIFKDKSHKFLIRHFNAQKKILLEDYGVNVIRLDI